MQNLMKTNQQNQHSEITFFNFENLNKNLTESSPNPKNNSVEIDNPIKIEISTTNKEESLIHELKADEKKEKTQQPVVDNQQLVMNNKEGKAIRFDDIPIKHNPQNFMELLEKQLVNDSYGGKPESDNQSRIAAKDISRYKSTSQLKKNKKENKISAEKEQLAEKKDQTVNKLNVENLDDASATQRENYKASKKLVGNLNSIKENIVAKSMDLRYN
jgi:hypothetical protein